ncbi:MAG: hypothetical protein ACKO34_01850 [Vampirovibrionales bacterium]
MMPIPRVTATYSIWVLCLALSVGLSGCMPKVDLPTTPGSNAIATPPSTESSPTPALGETSSSAATSAAMSASNSDPLQQSFTKADQSFLALATSVHDPFLIALPNKFTEIDATTFQALSPFAKALVASHKSLHVQNPKKTEDTKPTTSTPSTPPSGNLSGGTPTNVESLGGLLGTPTQPVDPTAGLEVSGIMYGNGHPMAILRSGDETNFGSVGETIRVNGSSVRIKAIDPMGVTVDAGNGKRTKLKIQEILGYESSNGGGSSTQKGDVGDTNIAGILGDVTGTPNGPKSGSKKPSGSTKTGSGTTTTPSNEDINKLVDALLK